MFLTIQKKRASQVVLSNKVSPTSTNHVWEIRNLLVETKLLTEQEIMRIDTLVTSVSDKLTRFSPKISIINHDVYFNPKIRSFLSFIADVRGSLPRINQSIHGQ